MSTPRSGRRRRRPLLAALVLAALSLVAAACGQEAEADDRSVASLPAADDTGASDGAASADSDGETDDNGAGDGGDGELSQEEAFLAYEQCMTDKGFDTDDFFGEAAGETIGGESDDDAGSALEFQTEEDFEAFEQADEECGEALEAAFGDFELTPEQEAAQRDAELQFNQCMADEGYPQEPGDDGAVGFEVEVESDADFEALEAAFAVCEDVINEALDGVFGEPTEEEGS